MGNSKQYRGLQPIPRQSPNRKESGRVKLAVPTVPGPGESLAGLIARSTANNYRRDPGVFLKNIGITKARLGSLCSRDPQLAVPIAGLIGAGDPAQVADMFYPGSRRGWHMFHGEDLREIYRESRRRRVCTTGLKEFGYIKAIWAIRPFSFDPVTKRKLIDTCPVCKNVLGWTLTYGVSFCDRCFREEEFLDWSWKYPKTDLRDFEQPRVEVDDEEALDFVTALIDPDASRKASARKLLPGLWAGETNGDLFELAMVLSSAAAATSWNNDKKYANRFRDSAGFGKFTPQILASAGRAIISGKDGFMEFASRFRPEELAIKVEHWRSSKETLGLLSVAWSDKDLSDSVRSTLRGLTEQAAARTRAGYMAILPLSKKFKIHRRYLSNLAKGGLVQVLRADVDKGYPTMMLESEVEALIPGYRDAVQEKTAACSFGVPRRALEELALKGLLERVGNPVLSLLEAEVYYSGVSIENLKRRLLDIAEPIAAASPGSVPIRRACVSHRLGEVPWVRVIEHILARKLKVYADAVDKRLLSQMMVAEVGDIADVLNEASGSAVERQREMIGNAVASEILGLHEVAVWRLGRSGRLPRRGDGAAPFRRSDVEKLSKKYIFVAEIARRAKIPTYRRAVAWLAERNARPAFELQKGRWLAFDRAKVESLIKGDTERGALAHEIERVEKLRANGKLVDFKSAATILHCPKMQVQMLANEEWLIRSVDDRNLLRGPQLEQFTSKFILNTEIKRRLGMQNPTLKLWLSRHKLRPAFILSKGQHCVGYHRAKVEPIMETHRPFRVATHSHPAHSKRKFIRLVMGGMAISEAALRCVISNSTAKRWASKKAGEVNVRVRNS
jgi:hypothetical protein